MEDEEHQLWQLSLTLARRLDRTYGVRLTHSRVPVTGTIIKAWEISPPMSDFQAKDIYGSMMAEIATLLYTVINSGLTI
jgi:hypothetical protein